VRASLSDEAERVLAVAAGGPVVGNELAVRASLSLSRRDGVIRNLTRDSREDAEKRDLARFKLLWEPSALDGLSVKLSYMHFRREGGALATYARTDEPGYPAVRIATDNTPNRTAVDFDGISAQVRYALQPDLALISATTWSKVGEASTFDGDYGPDDVAYGDQTRRYATLTQELRLVLTGRPLSGVVGLYYFGRDLASRTQSRTAVPTPAATIAGLLRSGGFPSEQATTLAEAYRTALPAIQVDFSGSFPTEMRSLAAFADLRWRLGSRVSLLAGLRIDRYDARNGTIQSARFAGSYPNPASFGALAPVIAQINFAVAGFVAQANSEVVGVESGATSLLPKAGMLIEWNDNLTTSFVAQRAFRPGGVSVNIARGMAVPYASEFAWNYEAALRARLAGGRLQFDANAYLMRWRNQQVTVNFGLNSFDTQTVNAGASRLYGFEVNARLAIRPNWSLRAAVGHARTRFDRFAVPQLGTISDLSGAEFAFAPRWTLVGGGEFILPSGLSGSLNVSHSTRAYGAVGANQAAYAVDPRTTVDLRLGYTGARWSGFVGVRNLFNDLAVMYRSPSESRAVLSQPRSVTLEVLARF
jgi:outer membrane receptor protein involved in Fe transport